MKEKRNGWIDKTNPAVADLNNVISETVRFFGCLRLLIQKKYLC